jgi:hypothetical protein
VKRAGSTTMARLASSNRMVPDSLSDTLLLLVERAAQDSRNYVKKGLNRALRETGVRNGRLHARETGVCLPLGTIELCICPLGR